MSTFKGTYYKRDVGLIDQAVNDDGTNKNYPEAYQPTQNYTEFLKFEEVVEKVGQETIQHGQIHSVEVKSIRFIGQGLDETQHTFVMAKVASSSEPPVPAKDGACEIRANITFTPQGESDQQTKFFTFKLPIHATTIDETYGLNEYFGVVESTSNVFQAAAEQIFSPIGNDTFKVKISKLNPIPKPSGLNIDGKSFDFPCGFHSVDRVAATDSAPAHINVRIYSLQRGDTQPPTSIFSLSYTNAGAGETAALTILAIDYQPLSKPKVVFTGSLNNAATSPTLNVTKITFKNIILKGKDGDYNDWVAPSGSATEFSFSVKEAKDAVSFPIVYSGKSFAIVTGNSAGVGFSPDDDGITNIDIKVPIVEVNAKAVIPLRLTTTANEYEIDTDWITATNFDNSVVPFYFKGLNYNESIGFQAADKSITTQITPAYTYYEQLGAIAGGTLLDFTTDAGFVIPIIDNGQFGHKYVRISDLYNEVANMNTEHQEVVPDLADRLHALEVGADNICSATLRRQAKPEAVRLFTIKEKWCQVDVESLS